MGDGDRDCVGRLEGFVNGVSSLHRLDRREQDAHRDRARFVGRCRAYARRRLEQIKMILAILLTAEWVSLVTGWLVPFALSSSAGALAGFGSYKFSQGETRQRIIHLESNVAELKRDQENYVTRTEFELLTETLRDIKTDVREIRRATSNRY